MADKNRKQRVLALLSGHKEPLKLSHIMQQIGDVPERTLRRWLVLWSEQGVLDKSGKGKSTAYRYINAATDEAQSFQFLQPLDQDLRQALLRQIRDLWTHHSTALEGNTLSLGDTHFILNEGLTISGKPIKDHQEVIGHSKAIDLIHECLSKPLSKETLFELHCAVQSDLVSDIYKPNGDWKLEPNGTYAIDGEGAQRYISYTLPAHVPDLMEAFISELNAVSCDHLALDKAHEIYAKLHMGFVHIHPFWDGNGRMARLVANIPLLKAGLPPLVISSSTRREYIECLARYQLDIGQLDNHCDIWPQPDKLDEFYSFCDLAYQSTRNLVDQAISEQNRRQFTQI